MIFKFLRDRSCVRTLHVWRHVLWVSFLFLLFQASMKDIPSCDWLQQWTDLARRYGDRYTCKMLTVLRDLQVFMWRKTGVHTMTLSLVGLHSSITLPYSRGQSLCLAVSARLWPTRKSNNFWKSWWRLVSFLY